jgi:6-pyruvoyltetrahydropterin/6-carboxytetrahydropterin synthase
MRVTKQFTFHAAHKDDEADDQCGRLHGHTYKLEVTATGGLDTGKAMLIHGDVLKEIYKSWIEPKVEHQYLNETLPCNPTMELVAKWMWKTVVLALDAMLVSNIKVNIRLWETPTMYCDWPGT